MKKKELADQQAKNQEHKRKNQHDIKEFIITAVSRPTEYRKTAKEKEAIALAILTKIDEIVQLNAPHPNQLWAEAAFSISVQK